MLPPAEAVGKIDPRIVGSGPRFFYGEAAEKASDHKA